MVINGIVIGLMVISACYILDHALRPGSHSPRKDGQS